MTQTTADSLREAHARLAKARRLADTITIGWLRADSPSNVTRAEIARGLDTDGWTAVANVTYDNPPSEQTRVVVIAILDAVESMTDYQSTPMTKAEGDPFAGLPS